jgi:hypothetical protein
MQVAYSWLRRSVCACPKRIIVGLSLFALPISICSDGLADGLPIGAKPQAKLLPLSGAARLDPRATQLKKFFARLHCPVTNLADDFIKAADENKLDWRLLPSISVVESGGGKACKNNNIFGWNQGAHVFASVRSSIQEVASKLAESPLYRRHHDAVGKLRVYNHSDTYVASVLALMDRISPLTPGNRLLEN